jgi:cyclopropane-fatty-acyl-phospholipid synthase
VYTYCLDVDELPELDRRCAGFGYNRRALVSIRGRDYLHGLHDDLRAAALHALEGLGFTGEVGKIELVTAARVLGYAFNPVSFWYIRRPDGSLACGIAEVNNTFGERHLYFLEPEPGSSFPHRFRKPRSFHVSPFNDMGGEYDIVYHELGDGLRVTFDVHRGGRRVFEAGIVGKSRPLQSGTIPSLLARYPLRASLTMPRILWQAAILHYRKGLNVFTRPAPSSALTIKRREPGLRERLGERAVSSLLSRARHGRLTIQYPDGTTRIHGDPDARAGAHIQVHDHRFFSNTAFGGDIGFGESYELGDWTTPDLTAVIEWFVANRDLADDRSLPLARIARWVDRLGHVTRANTLSGSRRNIQAHYDLGNDFFRRFLDPTMMYSSALFASPDQSLEEAQHNKLARLRELARIEPGHHVLEIGSGWGTFAIETHLKTGATVTTLTLSQEQFDHVQSRVAELGLEGRVIPRLLDYRLAEGRYDRIVSIEMLEAVGHENLPAFFASCDRLLAPDGILVLQVITMPDSRYEEYRKSCDWIQKYIFPGAVCPSLTAIVDAATRGSGLQVDSARNIGFHYARTLRLWKDRLLLERDKVLALGFPESFLRRWEYYFSYCEAGFATRTLGVQHLVLMRPCAAGAADAAAWNARELSHSR